MAEINQYSLAHKELLETLVKHLEIHEGLWQLAFNLVVSTGNLGPTPEQTFPGVMVTIPSVGVLRVAPGTPLSGPGVVIVDAAQVNPQK